MRSAPLVLVLLLVLCPAAACRDVPGGEGRPTTLASHPRAMARLARLMREQFTAIDPVTVEREIRCESRRVERVIGRDFKARQRVLTDSLRSEFTGEQFEQLGRRLADAEFPLGDDPMCRSLEAAAEGEAPLKP